MKGIVRVGLAALVAASCGMGWALAEEKNANLTIKQIMADTHKGKTAMVQKVGSGEASKEELQKLLGYYQFMSKQQPPKGDAKSWTEKTTLLVKAVEDVSAKKDGAPKAFQAAVNCKACHSQHKPD